MIPGSSKKDKRNQKKRQNYVMSDSLKACNKGLSQKRSGLRTNVCEVNQKTNYKFSFCLGFINIFLSHQCIKSGTCLKSQNLEYGLEKAHFCQFGTLNIAKNGLENPFPILVMF